MKSYQSEIQQLKHKLESNKLEMRLKQDEYSKHISGLIDELNSRRVQSDTKYHSPSSNRIEDSAIDEDSLSQNCPFYTSTAEFMTSKTITIPSHDSSAIYVIETENINETYVCKNNKLKQINSPKIDKADKATEADEDLMRKIAKKEKEMQQLLDSLNEQLQHAKAEKSSTEKQLMTVFTELKQYQTDNLSLSSKYETQVHYLNDQLQLFQVK